MKKTRFTEEQIALALHRAEDGTPVEEVCRKWRCPEVWTTNKWKNRFI
jgi:putative transposase